MRKFLSILVAVVMLMSMVPVFGAGTPVVKADSEPLDIVILYPEAPFEVEPDDCFYVNAVISNKGSGKISTTATLTVVGNASINDEPSKPISLGNHGTTDVWWKVCCTNPGDVILTVTAGGVSSKPVTIHQEGESLEKKLVVTWIETPCMSPFDGEVPVGTYFTVKAKLQSMFDFAGNVKITIGYTGDLELLSAPTVPVGDIYTDRDEEAAWNFYCNGLGNASVYIADVEVDNLTDEEILKPDPCSFYQGEPEEPPPTPGNWTITVNAPEKVCTDCYQGEFAITAFATNNSGAVANDVYAEIKILDGTLATLKDWTTQRQLGAPVSNGDPTATASWDIVCLLKGDTRFEVTFYKDGTPELGSGTPVISKIVHVNQKDFFVTIDDIQHETDDLLTTLGDVYVTEPCNGFYVKTTFTNCTCFPVNKIIATAEMQNNAELVKYVDIEEWHKDAATGEDQLKRAYQIPAEAVVHQGNLYILQISPVCDCCYYKVTWHFMCKGSDECPVPVYKVIFSAYDGEIAPNKLLDSDSFKLKQMTPPKLSAGINIFSGWFSDGPLGTTEITGIASACQGGALPDNNSKFSIVIPVANLGDAVANDVYVTAEITGNYLIDKVIGANKQSVNYTLNGSTLYFTNIGNINGLCAGGNAFKIIIEGKCTGDEDLIVKVTDLGGIDSLTGEPIPAKDKCGNPNIFLPKEKTLKQIPISFEIVEPIDGTSFIYSSNYAVKIKVHNCTNDDDNILKGLQATIKWKGPAEFNPETNETYTHGLGDLGKGGYAETGWNMHCNGVGDVKFTVTLTSEDPALTLTQTFKVHQDPVGELEVHIISPIEHPLYATGSEFAVTAIVHYHSYVGSLPAENVKFKIAWEGLNSELVDGEEQEIYIGEMQDGDTFVHTWTFVALTPNLCMPMGSQIVVIAKGTNVESGHDKITPDFYPAAKLIVQLDPIGEQQKGSDFTITGKVFNVGWADATDVKLTLKGSDNIAPQPGYSYVLNLGTVPALRPTRFWGDIVGEEWAGGVPFEFHMQCEEAGKTTITVTPEGKDEYGFSWIWDNFDGQDIFDESAEFVDYMRAVYCEGMPSAYALKPIPEFCLVEASTTFKQVLPGGPTLDNVSLVGDSPRNYNYAEVTFAATGGTPPYKYYAKVDNSPWDSPVVSPWKFTQLSEGLHRLYIKVEDANGLYYIGYAEVVIDTVAPPAPSANPIGGIYYGEQTVVLSDAEAGVSIYYTTDGTIPTTASSLYSGPIAIGEGITVLKAIAVDAAGNVSPVMTEVYNVMITPSTTSIEVCLVDGWNLVSVPFNASISALGTNVSMVLKWNGIFFDEATSLEPGVGYLVLHTGSECVTVSGTPTTSPFTINATGGYMVIGNPFEVPVAWSSITGTAHIVEAYYWDGMFWQVATGNLKPGVGYLIRTSDVGTLIFQRP